MYQIHIYTSHLSLLSQKWTHVWNGRNVGLSLNCTLDRMTREATDGWVAQKPTQAPLPNQWAPFYATSLSNNLCWWWYGGKLESIGENFLSYCADEASDSVRWFIFLEVTFLLPRFGTWGLPFSHDISTVLCHSICDPWISNIDIMREAVINVESQTPL